MAIPLNTDFKFIPIRVRNRYALQSKIHIRNFNPFLSTNLRTTTDFIYEPLVIFNQMQENKPVMRLAKNYYMSEDLTQVTFEIRDGVKWSDGKPFTAADVVYSFNLIKAKPELDPRGINSWIKAIKQDGNKVIFDLTEANSNLPYEISAVPIVPQHIWQDIKNPENYANENPVGSGPFTEIDLFTPQLYVQCRNPHYWDNDNLDVDCLRAPQIANNDQLLSKIIKSELDWSSAFIPDIEATQMIIDVAFYGNGVVNDYASGLGEVFKLWSDPETHNKYKQFNTYNVDNAKALLAKAGFKDLDGDGFVETPTGKKIELEVQSSSFMQQASMLKLERLILRCITKRW